MTAGTRDFLLRPRISVRPPGRSCAACKKGEHGEGDGQKGKTGPHGSEGRRKMRAGAGRIEREKNSSKLERASSQEL